MAANQFPTSGIPENKTRTRYLELDAMRGIAALMVVFFHFSLAGEHEGNFFSIGITGVDLFFIISGFVIFMTLHHVSNGTEFIINRISRLYPAYWAAVTFTLILILARAAVTGDGSGNSMGFMYFANMTMFQYYFGVPNIDGPYWTMIIEMLFYILILLLFVLKGFKYLNAIGTALCISLVAFINFGTSEQVTRILDMFPFLQFAPLFYAGIIYYKIYNGQGNLARNYMRIIGCMITQVVLFPFAGSSYLYIERPAYSTMLLAYFILFSTFVHNKSSFLVNRTTLFLGKISFTLYLTHQFISVHILLPFLMHQAGVGFWPAILITLPVVIGIASAFTYLVEIPVSKKLKIALLSLTRLKRPLLSDK